MRKGEEKEEMLLLLMMKKMMTKKKKKKKKKKMMMMMNDDDDDDDVSPFLDSLIIRASKLQQLNSMKTNESFKISRQKEEKKEEEGEENGVWETFLQVVCQLFLGGEIKIGEIIIADDDDVI